MVPEDLKHLVLSKVIVVLIHTDAATATANSPQTAPVKGSQDTRVDLSAETATNAHLMELTQAEKHQYLENLGVKLDPKFKTSSDVNSKAADHAIQALRDGEDPSSCAKIFLQKHQAITLGFDDKITALIASLKASNQKINPYATANEAHLVFIHDITLAKNIRELSAQGNHHPAPETAFLGARFISNITTLAKSHAQAFTQDRAIIGLERYIFEAADSIEKLFRKDPGKVCHPTELPQIWGHYREAELTLNLVRHGYIVKEVSARTINGEALTSRSGQGATTWQSRREIDAIVIHRDPKSGKETTLFFEFTASLGSLADKLRNNHSNQIEGLIELGRKFSALPVVLVADTRVPRHGGVSMKEVQDLLQATCTRTKGIVVGFSGTNDMTPIFTPNRKAA